MANLYTRKSTFDGSQQRSKPFPPNLRRILGLSRASTTVFANALVDSNRCSKFSIVTNSTQRETRSGQQPLPSTKKPSKASQPTKASQAKSRKEPQPSTSKPRNPSPLRQSLSPTIGKPTLASSELHQGTSQAASRDQAHLVERSSTTVQHVRPPSPTPSVNDAAEEFEITRRAVPSYELHPLTWLPDPTIPGILSSASTPILTPLHPSPPISSEFTSSPILSEPDISPESEFISTRLSPVISALELPAKATMATLLTGKAEMPAPGSSRAPKTFDGSEDNIAEFLEIFENCADDAQLPDAEKVSFIFRYLSRSQKDVFKTFDGYDDLDWKKFKAAIEEAFEGAFKEKKYTRQSLIQFTRNNATLPIRTDAELRAYQRGFQAITHYLIKEQIITEDDRDRYYWFGFHEDTPVDVFKAGKYVFDIDAFNKNPPEGFTPPETESKPQGGPLDVITRTVTLPATPSTPPSSSNVDDLFLRMKSLTIRDQEYAATYAKIQPLTGANTAITTGTIAPCMFCKDSVNIHRTRQCPVAQEYLRLKKISLSNEGYWRWPNGDRISSHPQGIKFVVDQAEIRTSVPPSTATTTQTQAQSFILTVDPVRNPTAMAAGFIEEISNESGSAFAAQANQKKPPIAANSPSQPTSVPSATASEKKAPQFQYQSKMEDGKAAQSVFDKMLDIPITIIQRELLAVSPDLRKYFIKDAPYRLLLGRPFQLAARADTEDIGDTLVMQDSSRSGYTL
ncbi:hypothetical protein M422DRAFT_251166 [Sphaerobolus stellatus SS14]|uniref:Retrotransposon gag domain-containing protein n=1 Tax=Sphaerobolus stellatus (strain SS14) TaxID=990650 RepID=A0A0C9W2Y1_SPHS4|nr:hypothetical protein M422DRAFT_251166 [Sphaerobolus stellatus SS14]